VDGLVFIGVMLLGIAVLGFSTPLGAILLVLGLMGMTIAAA